MESLWSGPLADGRSAHVAITDRSDGDLAPAGHSNYTTSHGDVAAGSAVPAGPWSWLRQIHSDRVFTVESPGDQAGRSGDALVTAVDEATLTVRVADCVPVALVAHAGAVAAAHAGWRGLHRGVLESTHRSLRALTPTGAIEAVVGPSICAACYEFGEPDLTHLAERFGPAVRSTTSEGTPAANLKAAVQAELDRLEVTVAAWSDSCTSCDGDRYWSYRARAEMERQAMVVRIGGSDAPNSSSSNSNTHTERDPQR